MFSFQQNGMMFDPRGLNSVDRKVVKTKSIHSHRTVPQILWLTWTSKMSFPPILASKRERNLIKNESRILIFDESDAAPYARELERGTRPCLLEAFLQGGSWETDRQTGTHTHTHTHTPLTPLLTHPKPCQAHLCKMEKQTRWHKKALSKRPREGKRTPLLEATTMCYKGMGRAVLISPPCTAHNRPGILQIRRSKLHGEVTQPRTSSQEETVINNNALLLAHQS